MLARTRLGRGLRTIAEDSDTALLLGVEVDRIVPVVFVISGLFAALAGVIFALNYRQVQPFMGEMVGLKGISAMIVGGMGNIWGSIAGGLIIGIVEVFSIGYFGADFVDIAVYGLLLFILFVRPTGLFAACMRAEARYERLSRRHSGSARDQRGLRLWRLPAARGRPTQSRLAGFAAIGGYSSAYLSNVDQALPPIAAIPSAGIAAGTGGARRGGAGAADARHLSGACHLRARPDRAGDHSQSRNRRRRGRLSGGGIYPACRRAAVAAVVVVLVWLLFATRFGIAVTAVHDDESVADLMGIDVRAFQVAAFALGSAIAGIGGGLYAHHFSFIEAQYFNISLSITIVLYVLLGGTQTVLGPLVGAGGLHAAAGDSARQRELAIRRCSPRP